MSFGFGVSDLIAVIEIANNVRKCFVGAPNEFAEISDEVRSLSIVMQDADVCSYERDLTSQQRAKLGAIVRGCRNVLGDLRLLIDKYSVLGSYAPTAGKKLKRAWKRLDWDSDEVQRLRGRINSNISLLTAFNASLVGSSVLRLLGDQERDSMLDWLCPADYTSKQSYYIELREAGTGLWLKKTPEFQTWVKERSQTLFCSGIPGAGKSVLASIVVKELLGMFHVSGDIGVAYIYFDYQQRKKQALEDLFASLLRQLLQGQPSLPRSIKSLFHRHKKGTRPSLDEITKILFSIAAKFSKLFIVVDALDECQIVNGLRSRFISGILTLQGKCKANLFVTSQNIPDVTVRFKNAPCLQIRARDEDIRKYLKCHMGELPAFVSRDPELQERIIIAITAAIDGMFLLANLHLHSLLWKKSVTALENALKNLPTGREAYHKVYGKTMERIEGQAVDQKNFAKEVLSWVVKAHRPLTPLELQHALGVNVNSSEMDMYNIPDLDDLLSACDGLIVVDEETNIVRFMHYTAQQYFEENWNAICVDAETDIAAACLTYLSFNSFLEGCCKSTNDFKQRLQRYPFYDYAGRFWGYHASKASVLIRPPMINFLKNESLVQSSCQILLFSERYPWNSESNQELPSTITGIHIAAYFGLVGPIGVLLEDKYTPDVKDMHQWTPLSWAASKGQRNAMKLLLSKDGVDLNSLNTNGQTPLSLAALQGQEIAVEILLKNNAKPDTKDKCGWTALSWAARNGHDKVIGLLLDMKEVDPDSRDVNNRTPLSFAAMYGHEEVVRLLLTRDDVQADCRYNNGRTPLSYAAEKGHVGIVKILLARNDVDPNASDTSYGRTSLSRAAWNGHEEVVRLLLAKAVDPNHKDIYGFTPLSLAVAAGRAEAVRVLLASDFVDINTENNDGDTPISLALKKRRGDVAKKLLLDDRMKLAPPDIYGRVVSTKCLHDEVSEIVEQMRQLYKSRGVNVAANFELYPATDIERTISCNICFCDIPDDEAHYHCDICKDGNFDVCRSCISSWTYCFAHSHRMLKRVIDDGVPVEVAD